jgi:acyl-CoA thioesterase I
MFPSLFSKKAIRFRVLCLGNSIMKADVGFNWLNALAKDVPDIEFVNKGENGSQIPGVIDIVKQGFDFKPSAILVHTGGNDVSCSYNEIPALNASRRGRQQTNLTVFSEEFVEMLKLLSDFNVPIGVFNLKPQGEDLSSALNENIRKYNSTIARLVAGCPNANLLDVYTPFMAEIVNRHKLLKYKAPSSLISDIVRPGRIVRVMLLHLFLFGWVTWNWIGEWEGFVMSCDGLHCNERAGTILCTLSHQFLESKMRRTS